MSPRPSAHDDAIQEIPETARATAARLEALQNTPGPEHETAEALARETAALKQAVDDARGTLAEAAELAAQCDGRATAGAQALAKSVDALRTQGEALDKRIRATGTQAQANARQAKVTPRQAEAAAQGIVEMKEADVAVFHHDVCGVKARAGDACRVLEAQDDGRVPLAHPDGRERRIDPAGYIRYRLDLYETRPMVLRAGDQVIAVLDTDRGAPADQAMFYVELTRARDNVVLLTDDREALIEALKTAPAEELSARWTR